MSQRRTATILFILLLFAYSYSHAGGGWNPDSRLNVLHSLVKHKSIAIDAYHGNTGDKSFYNGHYYSDKAPGTVVLAIPAFLLATLILHSIEIDIDSAKGWFISSWITTVGSVGIITALGGTLFYLLLTVFVDRKTALISVLATFLGSGAYTYTKYMFSHAETIGLLAIAMYCVLSPRKSSTLRKGMDLLAGMSAGFAVAGEYTASIVAISLFFLQLRRGWRTALFFILGSLPPLALIPLYGWITGGSFSAISYTNIVGWEGMRRGFFGITKPNISVAYKLLFSQARGLFFWTPFFLLMFAGLPSLFKKDKFLLITIILVFVLQIALISGYHVWDGGRALGPRHLAGLVPLIALPAAYGLARFPRIGRLLAIVSILLTGIATLITPGPPYLDRLIPDYYLLRLLRDEIDMNLGILLGLKPIWSIIFLLIIILTFAGFLATNCSKNINAVAAYNHRKAK